MPIVRTVGQLKEILKRYPDAMVLSKIHIDEVMIGGILVEERTTNKSVVMDDLNNIKTLFIESRSY